MEVTGAAATPCRPRSARYAEKGYPNYAEPDGRRAPRRRNDGGRAKMPAARRGRKRGRGTTPEVAAGKVLPLILQGEKAVAQEEGRKRKRRMAEAAVSATAAGKVSRLIEDEEEEVASTDGGGFDLGEVCDEGKSWRLGAKETLRAFSANYLHFVQEEQRRADAVRQELKASRANKCQRAGEDGKIMPLAKQHVKRGRKPKNGNIQDNGDHQEGKLPSKRPDLKALTKMQENGAILYREKRIGHLPGIDVGDQFYSRAEMVVLGLHSHWLNGIDYMGMKYRDKKGCEDFIFPLATCIVMSGLYEDDFDNANEIIYTGQGGNNWLGKCHQKTEQTLFRGNLALKNSKDNGNPIRVIRGHILKSSYTGKVYTYDGLYKVLDCWPQKGVE